MDELRKSIVNYRIHTKYFFRMKFNAMVVEEKLFFKKEELFQLEKKVDEFIERIENLSIETFNVYIERT